MRKNIVAIFTFLFLISCTKDIENITISGTVLNKITLKPIKNKNIEIEVECWKYGKSTDESYAENEKKIVKIDKNGNYIVKFNKGAFVTFEISICGYNRFIDELYIHKKENVVDLKL